MTERQGTSTHSRARSVACVDRMHFVRVIRCCRDAHAPAHAYGSRRHRQTHEKGNAIVVKIEPLENQDRLMIATNTSSIGPTQRFPYS